jgi:ATP-dependent RNA helicase RhlE
MKFTDFDIDPRCIRILDAQGIVEPTPVQEQVIPEILQGHDVIATAQTGTGKTLGFTLPTLTRLAAGKLDRNLMLVLVPTRELCVQVESVIAEIGKPLNIRSIAVYGGVGIEGQAQRLRQGRAVVVATPGRLLDHLRRGNVQFPTLEVLVLDEADRMLDMGFLPDLEDILRRLPKKRHTLMFSATFPNEIRRLADSLMREPKRIAVGAVEQPVDTVRQSLYAVRQEDKSRLLLQILEQKDITSAVVFLHTKIRTERLAQALKKKGYKVAAIHGDRTQAQRQQALDGFRKGRYRILVATDLAARGLDIEGITHVINYDIPPTVEDYLHRIGRTARAHAEGDAVTFVTPNEHRDLETIERALGRNLPRVEWEGAPLVLTMYHPRGEKKTERESRIGGKRVVRRTLLRRR